MKFLCDAYITCTYISREILSWLSLFSKNNR